MSPLFPTAALRAAAIVSLSLAAAGCGVFKTNEEAQVVLQRVVGMQVGDFFDRYGKSARRLPQVDGTTEYLWISAIGPTPNSGYYGLDDRTCAIKLVAGKEGRIVAASVLQDAPGRTSTSRCLEMFKA